MNEKHPTEIFPEEIWVYIFSMPDLDAEDLYRVENCCLYFQSLVEKRRIQDYLFPLALKIPSLRNLLKEDGSLPLLRSISKNFKECVDNSYSDQLKRNEYRYSRDPKDPEDPGTPVIFYYAEDVRRFLESFQPLEPTAIPAKRFVKRSICISYEYFDEDSTVQELQEITELFYRVFECIGDQVENLIYHGLHMGHFPELPRYWPYIILLRILSFCPNLKGLHPKFHELSAEDPLTLHAGDFLTMLEQNPFPLIPSLTTLTTEFFSCYCNNSRCVSMGSDLFPKERDTIILLVENIILNNPHIKHLDTNLGMIHPLCPDSESLGQLESVKVKCEGTRNTDFFSPDLDGYWYFQNCPLTNVSLYGNGGRGMKTEGVFRYLEKFANTLKKVTLRIFWNIEARAVKLNLPNVTYFSCNFYRGFSSLDFLSPGMGSLETLECLIERRDDWGEFHPIQDQVLDLSTEIQFVGYQRKMHESNVWDKLSKLKEIRVTHEKYIQGFRRNVSHSFFRVQ